MPKETKTVWLVRHGLTVSNVADTVQGLDDPLTEQGIEQAEKLGERFAKIPFDLLISSDALRAQSTANAIAKRTGHNTEHTTLLREITYPSELIGMQRTDVVPQEYFKSKRDNVSDPNYTFSDEESFTELLTRVQDSFSLIRSKKEESIVVVTHGKFMKLMIAHVVFGDDLRPEEWERFDAAFRTLNTGITLLKWTGSRWHLVTWNDHAHLGE